jgi:hypothetical protein
MAADQTPQEEIQAALGLISQATEGVTEGAPLNTALQILISQRNNAREYAESFRRKLKGLGHEFV